MKNLAALAIYFSFFCLNCPPPVMNLYRVFLIVQSVVYNELNESEWFFKAF